MPASVTAFCPGHISGYFKPLYGRDPHSTGSVGAGIVIDQGVFARVSLSSSREVCGARVDSNGRILESFSRSPPVEYLLEQFGLNARIQTTCMLPIGAGFGLSAAALTATMTALNEMFSMGLSMSMCCGYAHEAEIIHRTGLGDVAACQGGGRDCRKGAGVGAEIIRYYDLPGPFYAISFGALHSPSVLGSEEAMARVIGAFPGECPATIDDFFRFSREFSEKSGLITPKVRKALIACDHAGIPASMTMLGEGIFTPGSNAREVLKDFGEVFLLMAARQGPRVIEVME